MWFRIRTYITKPNVLIHGAKTSTSVKTSTHLVKKIHLAKNQLSRKISSPSSKLDDLQTKDPSQEEVNTEKRANLPGNPFHDTFPTIFPVRTITIVTNCADADSLAGF